MLAEDSAARVAHHITPQNRAARAFSVWAGTAPRGLSAGLISAWASPAVEIVEINEAFAARVLPPSGRRTSTSRASTCTVARLRPGTHPA